MSVSAELLLKAAKVYEAAESVDGMKPKEVYESHKKCAPGEFNMHKEGSGKRAGWYSEVIGSNVNPLNVIGNPAAALAAYLTPTRSLKEQAQADKSTWSNVLIPGKGAYNRWKRLGTTIRGPEISAARQQLKKKPAAPANDEPESTPMPEAQLKAAGSSQFNDFMNKLVNTPAGTEIYFDRLGLGGAGIGALAGALSAPKGKMLKRTLLGAGVGGLTGLGAGAGGSLGLNMALGPDGKPSPFFGAYDKKQINRMNGGLLLGLVGGGTLSNALANKVVKETGLNDDEEQDAERGLDAAPPRSKAAQAFGRLVARYVR